MKLRKINRPPSFSPILLVLCSVITAGLGVHLLLNSSADSVVGTVTDYIDSKYETWVPWGSRSHWVQPWRSYLETMPGTKLLNSVGVNFNVTPQQADPVSRILHANGYKYARLEICWGCLQAGTNSTAFTQPTRWATYFSALKNNNLRPLILLNANDGMPVPETNTQGTITATVPVGATTIQVDATTAAKIVPGRSGMDLIGPSVRLHNGLLFTSVDSNNVVTLSQSTKQAINTGTFTMHTFDYAPFQRPFLPNGSDNPAFDATMNGWLQYTDTVLATAKAYFGQNFDVEIWNEITFGSRFLDASSYYTNPPNASGTGAVKNEILVRTVNHIRQGNIAPSIGIGDGFANQVPWPSSYTEPAGLTAIDKHYYRGRVSFPSQAIYNSTRPIDALGQVSCMFKPSANNNLYPAGPCDSKNINSAGTLTDLFEPTYNSEFPEYSLDRIQTEDLLRDIGPGKYSVQGTIHSRYRPDGSYMPVWETEWNQDLSLSTPNYYTTDLEHYQAKALSRFLVSYVNKGLDRVYFFAASGQNFEVIDPSFYTYLANNNNQYPGDDKGGVIIDTIQRMLSKFSGAQNLSSTRPLSLAEIDDFQGNYQFAGDGTAAHPPLYNRDALGFFPYQLTANKFVVPMYIMTRDMAKIYNTSAPDTDPTRFDMPQEHYRLTINGINGDNAAHSISMYDPLTNTTSPVTVYSHSASQIVVDVYLTDSPRLLTIDDTPQSTMLGDLNHDGHVNVFDLSIFLGHWQQSGSGLPEDFNNDGIVNVFDLSILLNEYGS